MVINPDLSACLLVPLLTLPSWRLADLHAALQRSQAGALQLVEELEFEQRETARARAETAAARARADKACSERGACVERGEQHSWGQPQTPVAEGKEQPTGSTDVNLLTTWDDHVHWPDCRAG